MPTLDATTTAVFASTGVSASGVYNVMTSLISMSVSFGLWLIQVTWPFMLVIAFIYLIKSIAKKFRGFGRH